MTASEATILDLTVVPPEQIARSAAERCSSISARVAEFDISALLLLLYHLGWQDDEIEYRSHFSTSHHAALVQSVEFFGGTEGHPRRVLITVNLGLLSTQGPLPTYFQRVIERHENEGHDGLVQFIGFLDHFLLRERFAAVRPETALLPHWDRSLRSMLHLLGVTAPCTLRWLFRSYFPELAVEVRRMVTYRELRTDGVRLGKSALGDGSAFGGLARRPVAGTEVFLLCEDPRTDTGVPWGEEATRRLREGLLPLLHGCGLFLTLVLVILERERWATLAEGTALGFAPLYNNDALKESVEHRVVLFEGEVVHLPVDKESKPQHHI